MHIMADKTTTGAPEKLVQPDGGGQADLEKLHQEVVELREQVRAAERMCGTRRPTQTG
jgi:hypothetical protein